MDLKSAILLMHELMFQAGVNLKNLNELLKQNYKLNYTTIIPYYTEYYCTFPCVKYPVLLCSVNVICNTAFKNMWHRWIT